MFQFNGLCCRVATLAPIAVAAIVICAATRSFGQSLAETHAAVGSVLLTAQPAEEPPAPRSPEEPAEVPPPVPTPPEERPEPQPPVRAPEPEPQLAFLSSYRRSRFRMANVPNIFGDLVVPGNHVLFNKATAGNANGLADLPLAGAVRRMKIAENNKALPMDRAYFTYNHFHNALAAQNDPTQSLPASGLPTGVVQRSSIDRFVIGIEKTFLHERWSVDVRMPFSTSYVFNEKALGFGVFGDEIGNLNVVLKRHICGGDDFALALGLGIDVPTGSDVSGVAQGDVFVVHNDAVHLQPFVGCVGPRDRLFYHGFLQFDVDVNGNRIDVTGTEVGVLHDQMLLLLDLSAGYWVYRNPSATLLTGLAGVLEFHYTTTLQNTDRVEVGDVFNPPIITGSPVNSLFYNHHNQLDIANLTVGIHAELAEHITFRVGGVFPLSDRPDRLFDAEVAAQLNCYY